MINQEDLIRDLAAALKQKYGGKHQIVTQFVTASIKGSNIESRPDIVLYDGASDKLMIVEVKGTSPNNDLPLGTIQVLKKLKDANINLNPKIVLVSPSNVSRLVETQLLNEQIDLIKFDNQDITFNKIAELWDKYIINNDKVE